MKVNGSKMKAFEEIMILDSSRKRATSTPPTALIWPKNTDSLKSGRVD